MLIPNMSLVGFPVAPIVENINIFWSSKVETMIYDLVSDFGIHSFSKIKG